MIDLPEGSESAQLSAGLTDFGELRTAVEHSDYSLLELQWNGLRFAAVPALLRDGGVLAVLPAEACTDEELAFSAEEGFVGLVGPCVNGSCTLRGARRRGCRPKSMW